jgi:hypothetical protein
MGGWEEGKKRKHGMSLCDGSGHNIWKLPMGPLVPALVPQWKWGSRISPKRDFCALPRPRGSSWRARPVRL